MRYLSLPDTVAGLPLRAVCAFLLALAASGCAKEEAPLRVTGGDAERGLHLVRQYQCGACLGYIAGRIPNQPANLVRWLQDPPALKPDTAMPSLGVSEEEARHMAAYLYTLR